jgi:predicted TPR repeat methyltransferase
MKETNSWVEQFYDEYPRIEAEFRSELDKSLNPRGPDVLFDLIDEMGLPSGSVAVDVGCGVVRLGPSPVAGNTTIPLQTGYGWCTGRSSRKPG